MLGVEASWGLACATDIESVGDADMHMLVRAFGNAGADDGEILFLSAARGPGIDERGRARAKVCVPYQYVCETSVFHCGI
jgi:hypothetical protein